MQFKRLVVIGAGAIGGSIGGLLHESGFPVVLVSRGQHGKAIRESGLNIRMPNRGVNVRPECLETIAEVNWQPGDVAMIATKLNDAEAVMDQLLATVGDQVPVALATNGLHGERWAQQRFENVISMIVWLPATHLQAGEVRIHGANCPGILDNGAVGTSTQELVKLSQSLSDQLVSVGFDAQTRADIDRWKLAKLITNLGSAAQAMVTDDWKSVASAARQEGIAVLDAANLDHVPKEELVARTKKVSVSDVDGQPRLGGSTWQSRQRGTPLESCWIEGAIADLADEVGFPAPINRFLSDVSLSPRELTAAEVLER
ncbi:MAG: ketopantoate reductase family protein [Mariniblastus sp.]